MSDGLLRCCRDTIARLMEREQEEYYETTQATSFCDHCGADLIYTPGSGWEWDRRQLDRIRADWRTSLDARAASDRGEVHHLRGRNVAPEDRWNVGKARLLCLECHQKVTRHEVTLRKIAR